MKDKLTEYLDRKLNSLTTLDNIRLFKLMEIVQYSILYGIFSLALGIGIEYMFGKLFPYNEESSISRLLIEITLQCILLSLSVYYIRKIVHIIPFIFIYSSEYSSHKTMEYQGSVTMMFIFFGTQIRLMDKIILVRNKINNWLDG